MGMTRDGDEGLLEVGTVSWHLTVPRNEGGRPTSVGGDLYPAPGWSLDDLAELLSRARDAAAVPKARVWTVAGDEPDDCVELDAKGAALWLREWEEAAG